MAIHLTPTELGREAGMHRREVIAKCMELGVPIFQGRIDKTLFMCSLKEAAQKKELRARSRRRPHGAGSRSPPRIASPRTGSAAKFADSGGRASMEAVTAGASPQRRHRARRRSPTCCRWRSRSTATRRRSAHKVGDEWRRRPVRRARRASSSEVALGPGRPRHRAGREDLDPRPHPSRVDLRLLRHPDRRRHARHDLPDQLAGGVPVRPRALRLARGVRRGRRAARQDPRGRGRLPRAAARDRDGPGRRRPRRRDHPRRAARARPRPRRVRVDGSATRPSPPTTSASTSTRRAPPGPPKGCLLSHANYRAITDAVVAGRRARAAATAPTCSCRSRTRSRS